MPKLHYGKLIRLVLISLLLSVACQRNQAPEILFIQSSTESVVGAKRVNLSAYGVDKDGDPLSYSWSASGGTFLSQTSLESVFWIAPTQVTNSTCTIKVEVSDGKRTSSADKQIRVEGGKFIDHRDDNIYEFVQIGDQLWMTENLAFLPSVNSGSDSSITDPHYYVYDYYDSNIAEAKSEFHYKKYGVLYNWTAAVKACPDGWHLPSDSEWQTLELYLGAEETEVVTNQIRSQSGWYYYWTDGTRMDANGSNSSGLNVLASGYRRDYSFQNFLGEHSSARIWTSTQSDLSSAWSRGFDVLSEAITREQYEKNFGFSVRCVHSP